MQLEFDVEDLRGVPGERRGIGERGGLRADDRQRAGVVTQVVDVLRDVLREGSLVEGAVGQTRDERVGQDGGERRFDLAPQAF